MTRTETTTPSAVAGMPTPADVAALAGASPATVSRVIKGSARVGHRARSLAGRVRPRLTTVRRPIEEMGARLARELLRRITGAPDRNVVLDTELINGRRLRRCARRRPESHNAT